MSCFGGFRIYSQSLNKAFKSRDKVAWYLAFSYGIWHYSRFIESIPKEYLEVSGVLEKKIFVRWGDKCGCRYHKQYICRWQDNIIWKQPSTNLLHQEDSIALSFMTSFCNGKLKICCFKGLFSQGLYTQAGERKSPRPTKMILTAVPALMKMRCQLSRLINGMTHLRAGLVLINWSKIYVSHLSQSYSRARAIH